MLDPALVRPGRFDRIIYVGAPDFEGRIEVLKVCARVLAASAISVCPVCRGPGLIKSFPYSMEMSCEDACNARLYFVCLQYPASCGEEIQHSRAPDFRRVLQ